MNYILALLVMAVLFVVPVVILLGLMRPPPERKRSRTTIAETDPAGGRVDGGH
ncbi:MAG: hypothetical protein ACR2PL_26100 [Dehalococcoidia bacterium]